MARKASIKYRSLRSNLVNLPLSLYAQLGQQQVRPQSLILYVSPIASPSSSSIQQKAAYLGWSGLNAAATVSQMDGVENLEVDPEVAMSLGWAEGTVVEIAVIHNPTIAKSVSVTPLTPDDWEILEQHASFLENNLLSQLRAAQKGQEMHVWVMGTTKIRIRVDDTNPSSSVNSAVLIKADTEIFVAPRSRMTTIHGTKQTSSTASTMAYSKSQAASSNIKSLPTIKLRLVPPRIASSWGQFIPSPEDLANVDDETALVCSEDDLQRIKRYLRATEDKPIYVKVESYSPLRDQPSTATQQEPQAENAEVLLTSWKEMPRNCVTFIGKTKFWQEAWGTVAISLVASRKGKRRTGKGKHIPDLSLPPASPRSTLIGLQDVLGKALGYLGRLAQYGRATKPLLLLGAKGSGKTSHAEAIATDLFAHFCTIEIIYEDVGKLDPNGRLVTLKENMDQWFRNAVDKAPCTLILDDLDTLLLPETESNPSSGSTILTNRFLRLFTISEIPPGVLVIATATDSSTLHPLINTRHIFGETVKIPPLTKDIRQDVLRTLVKEKNVITYEGERKEASELDYVHLGGITEGYSLADLTDLTAGAMQQAIIRSTKSGDHQAHLTLEDFTVAHEDFTPFSLRGVTLQMSDIKWSDIGGLVECRRVLRETLEWPTKYAQIFANCPLRLRSGLLLYGFPGCGKTLLASAVAKECGLNFISVKGPEILNKYIGASEKNIRDLFERASGAKPCVLFFDEFDSIAPKRGHDSTGVTDRVVNQLLTEMDGAQSLSGVYVLAATSRPDLIDPALLRPGRLDKSILCDMPCFSDRLDILHAVIRKGSLQLGRDVDLEVIANETEGYSGADLQAVVYNAHLDVVHSSLDQDKEHKESKDGSQMVNGIVGTKSERAYRKFVPDEQPFVESAADRSEMTARIKTMISMSHLTATEGDKPNKEIVKPVINQQHLLRSLAETRPSITPADKRRLEKIYNSFVNSRDAKLQNGDLGRETGTRTSLM
nr:peroxin-1 [Cryptococcus depauperatus CBS 7855]